MGGFTMSLPKSSVFAFSALSFFLLFALGLAAPNLAYAKLVLTPNSLAFGNVVVGTTSSAQTVTATNSGRSAITFTTIIASPPFLKVGDTCDGSLGGGLTCHVDVECMPTTTGLFNGTLTFNLSKGKPATVALTCTGVPAPTPTATPTATPSATP